ncbi:MAG: ATP-binding protein [Planctomycetes bacterium]|nr:ATP-binding protein [Planctomycetota bacterium]
MTSKRINEVVDRIFATHKPGDPSLYEEKPFTREEEFWGLQQELFDARCRLRSVRDSLAEARKGSLTYNVDSLDKFEERLDFYLEFEKRLVAKVEKVARTIGTRSELTKPVYPAPRILRLAHRAKFGDLEQKFLVTWILRYMGVDEQYYGSPDIQDICRLLELGLDDLFLLANMELPLFVEKILIKESNRYETNPHRVPFSIESGVLKCLRGLSLTEDDLCLIGEGHVRDLLEEEVGKTIAELPPVEKLGTRSTLIGVDRENEDGPLGEFNYDELYSADADAEEEREDSEGEVEGGEDDEPRLYRDTSSLKSSSGDPRQVEAAEIKLKKEEYDPGSPYENDLEYLGHHIEWFKLLVKSRKLRNPSRFDSFDEDMNDKSPETRRREVDRKLKIQKSRIDQKLALTRQTGKWLPRAEILAQKRNLTEFEKQVVLFLVGLQISEEFMKSIDAYTRAHITVGDLISIFFSNLEEQVRSRSFFYRSSPLIRDSLVNLSAIFGEELLACDVSIDRRMADYILGLEAEGSSMVEGTHLYSPVVDPSAVIISDEDRKLIFNCVESFPAFQKERKRSGLDKIITYGNGIVLLFYGPSGTGKTLMANAIASKLGKKILLINYPKLGHMNSDETLRIMFRESKVHDAILFFDECESIFESREEFGSGETNLLLSAIERHDGLIVLATNRPFDLDEAMHRRITLAVEFKHPDVRQREDIWKVHIPKDMKLAGELDFRHLAYKYDLTGGLIKNAVLAALSIAVSRNQENPEVRMEDFEEGARRQVRGRLQMVDFDQRFVPQSGLESLVVPEHLGRALSEIVLLEKARPTLVGQWGFLKETERGFGISALFHGQPGTGKSLAAEVIGFELGRPIKKVNAAQVTSHWVGQGAKNIQTVFREAKDNDAVLVFDEADALFAGRTSVSTSTDRYANLDVSVLLREMEHFPGIVILTSNLSENIDEAFKRRLRFILKFPAPEAEARESLWKLHIPDELPRADDIDLRTLAVTFEMTGAQIRNAVLKAAAVAALRDEDRRFVSQKDLHEAARMELEKDSAGGTIGFGR